MRASRRSAHLLQDVEVPAAAAAAAAAAGVRMEAVLAAAAAVTGVVGVVKGRRLECRVMSRRRPGQPLRRRAPRAAQQLHVSVLVLVVVAEVVVVVDVSGDDGRGPQADAAADDDGLRIDAQLSQGALELVVFFSKFPKKKTRTTPVKERKVRSLARSRWWKFYDQLARQ